MAVSITLLDSYKHYGRCLKLENGSAELLVTIDLGPRIIRFAAPDGENLFFNDDEDVKVDKSPFFKQIFGEDAEFHFYGGHRMWLAPQQPIHTESPDNEPLSYELIENGVTLTAPEAKVIGFKTRMTIVMDPEKPEFTVTSALTNTTNETKKNAVWQVTQCAPGGVGFYPFTKPFRPRKPFNEMTIEDMSGTILPSAELVLFIGSYTDKRFIVDDRYITFASSDEKMRPIKIGTRSTEGWAMYANKGYVLRFDFPYDPDAEYTDWGCNFESYTDASFHEIEMLGPLKTWYPGDTITHTETISFQKQKAETPDLTDREAVASFIELHK